MPDLSGSGGHFRVPRVIAGISLSAIGITSLSTLMASCYSLPLPQKVTVTPSVRDELSEEKRNALMALEQVENKLDTLEKIRSDTLKVFWPFVEANPALKQRYEFGLRHHRALCCECGNFKLGLCDPESNCSDERVAAALAWAVQTNDALDKILELINYVKSNHGRWPTGWTAPVGFEYIKAANADE